MAGLPLGLLLIFSLLAVFNILRRRPMPPQWPLNVDDELLLPELCQTSTVFSLTALFGAYLGIAVALGLPGLSGLATGTVVGLFVIWRWIRRELNGDPSQGVARFEDFLTEVFKGTSPSAKFFGLLIPAIQCVYAASELLILRELGRVAFSFTPEQATLWALTVAIIGYFYIVFGGYEAVFRTDVVQLFFVIPMAIVLGIALLIYHPQISWTAKLFPAPRFWTFGLLGTGPLLRVYHFIFAAIMALGLLLVSPDTWKRVFQVSKRKRSRSARFLTFAGVGILPYVVLFPFVLTIDPPLDATRKGFELPAGLSQKGLFMVAGLGLVASFLSAFNSAMLASVHVGIIIKRKYSQPVFEESRFYWLMVIALFVICTIFVITVVIFCHPGAFGFNNAWLLGNLLMGAYAIVAGALIGTLGRISRLRSDSLIWVFAVCMLGWFGCLLYFYLVEHLFKKPSFDSMNTVPAGVIICFVAAILSRLLVSRENA
jgi:Na+/proline symporter